MLNPVVSNTSTPPRPCVLAQRALAAVEVASSYVMKCRLALLKRKGVWEHESQYRLKPLAPVRPEEERRPSEMSSCEGGVGALAAGLGVGDEG